MDPKSPTDDNPGPLQAEKGEQGPPPLLFSFKIINEPLNFQQPEDSPERTERNTKVLRQSWTAKPHSREAEFQG